MNRDPMLAYMRTNLPPKRRTLEAYIALSYFGDKTLHDVLQDAELVAELPIELVRNFLAFSPNASDLNVDDLVMLRSCVDEYEDEVGE